MPLRVKGGDAALDGTQGAEEQSFLFLPAARDVQGFPWPRKDFRGLTLDAEMEPLWTIMTILIPRESALIKEQVKALGTPMAKSAGDRFGFDFIYMGVQGGVVFQIPTEAFSER